MVCLQLLVVVAPSCSADVPLAAVLSLSLSLCVCLVCVWCVSVAWLYSCSANTNITGEQQQQQQQEEEEPLSSSSRRWPAHDESPCVYISWVHGGVALVVMVVMAHLYLAVPDHTDGWGHGCAPLVSRLVLVLLSPLSPAAGMTASITTGSTTVTGEWGRPR